MIIITIIINSMHNILYLKVLKNQISSQFLPNELDKINIIYFDLVNAGFSTCSAINEVIKLLLFSNPKLTLTDISKKKSYLMKLVVDNNYYYSIDNHSHKQFNNSRGV